MKAEQSRETTRIRQLNHPSQNDGSVQEHFAGPSMTKQEFKNECDINNIMRQFEDKGRLPEMIQENPQYGDFSEAPTYHEACNIVAHAQEQFLALPAEIRKRFSNDPGEFLKFVHDPNSQEELVKMGLATKKRSEDAPEPIETPSSASKQKAPKEPTPKGGAKDRKSAAAGDGHDAES